MPSTAKFIPPTSNNVYSRVNLKKELQDNSDQRLIWLSAPAGAGKTTLVADYLSTQANTILWYQIDADDSDAATFFHYLSLAQQGLQTKPISLPQLTPEYHNGLVAFTRHFTGKLCAGLPQHTIFVFDNFQELTESSPLQLLLGVFIETLPNGFRVFFLSRDKPPAWFAKFVAQGIAHLIAPERLRLTAEESLGIANLLAEHHALKYHEEELRQIHVKVNGWATGLVLVLRASQQDRENRLNWKDSPALELIFAYFANELFSKLAPEQQVFLLHSALLPAMPQSQINEFTGIPSAEFILRDLYARNLFITRSGGEAAIYQYHALFREFLLKKGLECITPEQRQTILRKASHVLLASGQAEQATDLALSAQDWQVAASLIASQAPNLIAQGRNQMLMAWLGRLPDGLLSQASWLRYWAGIALSGIDPITAEQHFSAAFPLFRAEGEVVGMYLTIASVIHISWMTQQNHAGLDPWLRAFEQLYADVRPDSFPPEIETRVISGILMGLYYREPSHPQGEQLLERAKYLWNLPLDANLRWQLGSAIGFFVAGREELASWAKTVRLYQPEPQTTPQFPLEELHLLLALAFIDSFTGAYDASREGISKGLALAEHSGVHVYDLLFLAVSVYNALLQGNLAEADSQLETMRVILATLPPNFHTVHYRLLLNWQALCTGEFNDALDHAKAALELALANGAAYPIARCRQGLALALFAVGQQEEALDMIGQACIPWGNGKHQQLLYDCTLVEAWFYLRMGDENTASHLLQRALEQGKAQGWGIPLWSFPDWLEPLFSFALEQNIGTEHIQRLIRQAGISPRNPDNVPALWPSPIKIHTLGRFWIEVAGKALNAKVVSKNKPLELLKLLLAFGGQNVAEGKLIDALWPDAQGDTAITAFNTTLHRLRKVLGNTKSIILKDGQLSLNRKLVWADNLALQANLNALEQKLLARPANGAEVAKLLASIQQIYHGKLMENEPTNPWMLVASEKLSNHIARIVLAAGRFWEEHQEGNKANECYRYGIAIEPMAETFYRLLMENLMKQQRYAEAIITYEKYQEVLMALLNTTPSQGMVKLYSSILDGKY